MAAEARVVKPTISSVLTLSTVASSPIYKKDITVIIKALKQNLRNSTLCREYLLVLHSRLFEDKVGARESFSKFVLNANGGVATLLATIEHHMGDCNYLEVALVYLCNLMHFGGRRNPRVVAKVVKKGGSRIALTILNRHANNIRVIHPATMAIIALASVDSKIIVAARVTGGLSTLVGLLRNYANLPREGVTSVISCVCSLSRGDANIIHLARKGAVSLLLEMCAKHLRQPGSSVLLWGIKAVHLLCTNEDNGKEAVATGAVILLLHALYEQPESVDIQKACLESLRSLVKIPDGLLQLNSAGGFQYVASLVIENSSDKQETQLLELVVQLYRFFGIVELPIGSDNDLYWTPPQPPTPTQADAEYGSTGGQSASQQPQALSDHGGTPDGSLHDGLDNSYAETPTSPLEAAVKFFPEVSPELNDGKVSAENSIPESVVVHHVKPFSDPRPSPSCLSCIDFVPPVEELLVTTPTQRTCVMRHEWKRLTNPELLINQVVYDDLPRSTVLPVTQLTLLQQQQQLLHQQQQPSPSNLTQGAGATAASIDPTAQRQIPVLKFGSNFESGNLKRAIQVFDNEYDLILQPDINTNTFCQWFFFSVENVRHDVTYKFNIINLEKPGSTFNEGQRPLMFSERRFAWSGFGWLRTGHSIQYMRNSYRRRKRNGKKDSALTYYTLTFSVRFPHDEDRCYICNCYPYTYSDLIGYVKRLGEKPHLKDCFMVQSLCNTQSGNLTPLITITTMKRDSTNGQQQPYTAEEIRNRYVCVVSARVHPGETGASYVVKGLIDYLCDTTPQARQLRDKFVWKIVPMLNPDGVINGNHRCALSGKDLNREFTRPDRYKAPTIFHLKEMIRHIKFQENRSVILYGDFHGHSRRKNFFVYACGISSKKEVLPINPEKVFPQLLGELVPYFSAAGSSYKVQRSKETTGRVVIYRQLGVRMSFTLEGSLMGGDGCDFLPLSWDEVEEDVARRTALSRQTVGHFNTGHYATMGGMFAKGALLLIQAESEGEGRAYDLVSEMIQDASALKREKLNKDKSVGSSPASGGAAGAISTSPNTSNSLAGGDSDSVLTPTSTGGEAPMSGSYVSNRRGSLRRAELNIPRTRIKPVCPQDIQDVFKALLRPLAPVGTTAGRGRRDEGGDSDEGGDEDEDELDRDEEYDSSSTASEPASEPDEPEEDDSMVEV